MKNWKAVPDEVVRSIWQCQEEDCSCGNSVVYLSPDWYQENGTPTCECDEDMVYLYTEVVDSGDDGEGAWVEILEADEIPEIIKPIEKTHTFDFCFNVKSNKNSDDLTGEELKHALLERIRSMNTDEFVEACGIVDTTYDNEDIN